MDREDIYSIIAYLRTLSPIESTIPESVADAPFNFLIHTMPQKAVLQTKPDTTDQLAYGAYVANASGCVECHSPLDKGQIIKELAFSGGRDFGSPDGSIVRSANITPDDGTGIGKWSREQFIAAFKQYADSSYVLPSVKPGEFNTVMPWTMYANMTESDLSALYSYLRSVKPISKTVVKFTPGGQAVSME
jgi:mono/diheme cytochrome c family protein